MENSSLHGYPIDCTSEGTMISLYTYLENLGYVRNMLIELGNMLEPSRIITLDEYIRVVNKEDHEFLFRGDNDYRYYQTGDKPFIPTENDQIENWGNHVYGNGLYLSNNETAKFYGNGITSPLGIGGKGCAKNMIISSITLGNDPQDYHNCMGMYMKEKQTYATTLQNGTITYEGWDRRLNNGTHNIYFIVSCQGGGSEFIWKLEHEKLEYAHIERILMDTYNNNGTVDMCNKRLNLNILQDILPDDVLDDCKDSNNINCPTTCKYMSGENTNNQNKLPSSIKEGKNVKVNCNTGEYDEVNDDGNYKHKYLKYKNKFIKYKNNYYN